MGRMLVEPINHVGVCVIDRNIDDVDSLAMFEFGGKMNFVAADSLTGHQALYWWRQGDEPTKWEKFLIDGNPAHFDASDVEGTGAFELGGVLYVASAQQDAGSINLYHPTVAGQPTGTWQYAKILTGKTWMQSLWSYDIDDDGEDELVYASEGTNSSSGGIYYLDLTGANPMNPAHWTEYEMLAHPGAFWIVKKPTDIAGNGRGDLVCTARASGRNPDCLNSVFWVEAPADPTDPWTKHDVDLRDDDWIKADIGDFYGTGIAKDIVASAQLNTRGIVFYPFSNGYSTHDRIEPQDNGDHNTWNLITIPVECGLRSNNRDAIFAVHGHDYPYIYQNEDGEWVGTAFDRYPTYEHSAEGAWVWHDLDGDGIPELILSDSAEEHSQIAWLKIGSGLPEWTPAQPTTSGGVSVSAWYKADTAGFVEDETISAWPDLSGNENHLTQTTVAAQPTFVFDSVLGLPMVRFGGDDALFNSVATFDLRAITFFFLGRQTGIGANQGLLVFKPATGNDSNRTDALSFRTGASDGARPDVVASTPTTLSIVGTDTLVDFAIWCYRKAQGGTARLYKNGVLVATDATYTEFDAASGGGLIVGGRWTAGALNAANRLIGDVVEIAVAPGELSVADTNQFGAYFARWGLVWTPIS